MKKVVVFSCCVVSLSGMRFDSCANKDLLWDQTDLTPVDFGAIKALLARDFNKLEWTDASKPVKIEPLPAPLLPTPQQPRQRQPSFERHQESQKVNAPMDAQRRPAIVQQASTKQLPISSSKTSVVTAQHITNKKPSRVGKRARTRYVTFSAKNQGK